jgi:hypothetical protein
MGHYIIPGKVGPGVFPLVGLFWRSARYYSYEDMYIKSILVMILCYFCLLAIYLVVTVREHCVILQQIVKYTYINKHVSLIWG